MEHQVSGKQIIAVIDGDEIAYRIAAACEKRTINVINKSNGKSAKFNNRTELKNILAGLEVPEGHFDISDHQEADKIENALHSVKVSISNIKEKCKADKVELYLSGKDNFRDSIPLPTRYKASRDDTIRPLLLKEIREYIETKYSAVIVNGQEVDDVVCHRMYDGFKNKEKIVGVTTDKDARGSVGWLFNPDKMSEPEFINGLGKLYIDDKDKVRGEGRKWLYCQTLMGDPTDDYKPTEICKVRFGEKGAFKILDPLTTDQECWQAIYDTYKKWYPDMTTYTDWQGVERTVDVFFIMQMYFDCARMRKFENDTCDVKELLIKMGVKF